jgi:hypothetical protein
MTRMRYRKAVLLITALTLISVLSPTPASAEVTTQASCYIVCDGVDPNTAAYEDANGVLRPCRNDARTIYTVDPPSTGYAELRYSGRCRMAWARGGLHGIKIEGFNANGSLRVVYTFFSTSSIGWTQAVNDAGQTARACVLTPSGGGWTCTPRY